MEGKEEVPEAREEKMMDTRVEEETSVKVVTFSGVVNNKEKRIRELDLQSVPESYRKNSRKEELCLAYAAAFNDQFKELFPGRKPVVLCPLNEVGVEN